MTASTLPLSATHFLHDKHGPTGTLHALPAHTHVFTACSYYIHMRTPTLNSAYTAYTHKKEGPGHYTRGP